MIQLKKFIKKKKIKNSTNNQSIQWNKTKPMTNHKNKWFTHKKKTDTNKSSDLYIKIIKSEF